MIWLSVAVFWCAGGLLFLGLVGIGLVNELEKVRGRLEEGLKELEGARAQGEAFMREAAAFMRERRVVRSE